MRIEAEHFDIAVRTAYKKKNDAGILFDQGAMADFRETLDELARIESQPTLPWSPMRNLKQSNRCLTSFLQVR